MTSPSGELREAAALLRDLAGKASPGPWRTHDTWVDAGGYTATVFPEPTPTKDGMLAWLPTFSSEPWDQTKNAWNNAEWIAMMSPAIAEPLAALLDHAADVVDRMDRTVPGGQCREDQYVHSAVCALAFARSIATPQEAPRG